MEHSQFKGYYNRAEPQRHTRDLLGYPTDFASLRIVKIDNWIVVPQQEIMLVRRIIDSVAIMAYMGRVPPCVITGMWHTRLLTGLIQKCTLQLVLNVEYQYRVRREAAANQLLFSLVLFSLLVSPILYKDMGMDKAGVARTLLAGNLQYRRGCKK